MVSRYYSHTLGSIIYIDDYIEPDRGVRGSNGGENFIIVSTNTANILKKLDRAKKIEEIINGNEN